MFAALIQRFFRKRRKPEPFTAMPVSAAGQWLFAIQREAEAKREARQYAEFDDVLAGAIVGAPADPEAFG